MLMHRSFEERMRQMLEEREGAYPLRYVTERATTQVAYSFPNPSGEGACAPTRRCCVGHDAPGHRFLLAPRFSAQTLLAIGALTSSEVP